MTCPTSRYRSRGSKAAAILVLAVAVLAALTSCRGNENGDDGGDGPGPLRILLEATSETPPDDATLTRIETALLVRLEEFGLEEAQVERQDSGLLVTIQGTIAPMDAGRLLTEAGSLDLRQPARSESGEIACVDTSGRRFNVTLDAIRYTARSAEAPPTPLCVDGDTTGAIAWEPATYEGARLDTQQPLEARVTSEGAPVVIVSFGESNRELLEAITSQLVGLPLGIFLNGRLTAAPRVAEPLTTSNVAIGGLSLNDARIAAAQLTSGPLPVTVRVAEVEGLPQSSPEGGQEDSDRAG